ncbi:hypothetical protein [Bacillus cytotoxicus]|uniref:hypothetical protein n=1 Tax=Bacillus cytotoxicus TaxID=580165 RepID=UPI001AEE996E|nr:hypothetical protein [Bacillus cytotoxicus]QTR78180.1 hypothetical protein JC773_16910 [Bacillus cytotoxicus]
MNKKFGILMKITPPFSVVFLLIGLTMGVLGVFDQNVKMITASLFIMIQSVLALLYVKSFKQIWEISYK